MTKLEKVAISHNFNSRGCWGVFVPLQEQFAENTNKSYHVCNVIIVIHIHHLNVWYQISRTFCKQK